MPEIRTFDAAELAEIRSAVATWDDPGVDRTVIDLDYARDVIPAMADKIEQLRDLYDQAVLDLRWVRRQVQAELSRHEEQIIDLTEVRDRLNTYRPARASDQVSS